MTAAIYARVSTDRQTAENQVQALQQLATARGLGDTAVFTETESGAKRRPVLEGLLERARRGEFKTLLIWAIDRLGRGGALEALTLLSDLSRYGVAVVSLQEPWADSTVGNPFRDVLIAMAATVARLERDRLIERTKAGMQRARAQGKRIGRPPSSPVALTAAADAVRAGQLTQRAAAAKWNIGASTLRDFLSGRRAGQVGLERCP